ncbi:PREDICTED: uncharacterized protein LOC103924548 [Pygoscelis adeliae]|nr:PREDICTED: uncharacterized protein LOC103924548 [Pygoscelis adeliae]
MTRGFRPGPPRFAALQSSEDSGSPRHKPAGTVRKVSLRWALGSRGTTVKATAKRIVVRMASGSFPATFCFGGTDDEHCSMRGNSDTNLPFSVDNKWRLLAVMCGFFGSGFIAPFVIVRHQLLKK